MTPSRLAVGSPGLRHQKRAGANTLNNQYVCIGHRIRNATRHRRARRAKSEK